VGVVGYAPYIKDIWKKTTKPDRIAWLIWTFEYTALFFAQASAGALWSLWLVGLQLVGVAIIFGLSLKYGVGRFTRSTYLLLVIISASLVVWNMTDSAALAIIILLAVEASGVIITAVKTYKSPGSETLSFWYLIAAAGLLGVLAVEPDTSPILYLYPVSLIVMSSSVIAASYLGGRRAQKMPLLEDAAS
jgi:hypothetical protein